MNHEPEDLELVVDHHQAQAIESGHPPLHLAAWRRACTREMLENERAHPGYLERSAAGLRARSQGLRATGWREVRGTHGIDYVPDPNGTARPPWAT